jgi:hypothetical protein
MTVPELLRRAASCEKCGKPHEYRRISDYGQCSWASPDDGHPYASPVDVNTIARLYYLATGKYQSPWTIPCPWWTEEIVQGRQSD